MKNKIYILVSILIFSCPLIALAQTQKSISLTTYYPAPMGAFDQFRLIPFDSESDIGDVCTGNEGLMHVEIGGPSNGDGQLRFCFNDGLEMESKWSLISGAWKQVGDTVTPADTDESIHIGIGTTTPDVFLHIHDNEDGYEPLLPNIYQTSSDDVPLMITGVDVSMHLIGYDQSHGQSSIHLLQVEDSTLANGGDFLNMWTLGRRSSSGGVTCDGCLYISYLDRPVVGNFWNSGNSSRLHLTQEGNLGIGRFGEWPGDALPQSTVAAQKELHLAFAEGETALRLQEIGDYTSILNDNIWDLKAIGNSGTDRFSIYGGIYGDLQEALVVTASDGYVGIGTTDPENQLHIAPDAGEEALRLEGTNESQIIEFIDTNDSDFRILNTGEDLHFEYNNGSGWKKAFYVENYNKMADGSPEERIVFGTPSILPYEEDENAEVWVHGDGNVVLSDGSALVEFANVASSDPTNEHYDEVYDTALGGFSLSSAPNSPVMFFGRQEKTDGSWTRMIILEADTKHAGIMFPDLTHPSHTLDVNTAPGFYCEEGSWHYPSSRKYKTDIEPLALSDALEALEGLHPVTFRYKANPQKLHTGFIAEDLPDLVATEDRKTVSPNDLVSTLTKVTQHLHEKVKKRNQILKEQEDLIRKMKEKLNNL